MKIEYKDGATYCFDYEIDKALHEYECGVPIIDFLKYEAENFKYGKDAYINVLNKEIEDYESRDWDSVKGLYPYAITEIIEGVKEIKKALFEIQKPNIPPPAKQFETNLTGTQIYQKELYQSFEKQSKSLSATLKKDEKGFKLMEESINEQFSIPIPFPIEIYEFNSDEITISDFPNVTFLENYEDHSINEYIEGLKTDFKNWNELLLKLPTCESDVEIYLSIMDKFIEEYENSIWRNQFLAIRNGFVKYPIDGRIRKLERSRMFLAELIEDEKDDLKNQILSGYLVTVNKALYPDYILPEMQTKKTKHNQLPTKLTDTQRGKLFDLLVSNEFIPNKDKDGFIWAFGGVNDNYTSYSTEWLKTLNLSVYLIDKLCYDPTASTHFWAIGERIFLNVKGMRNQKQVYLGNGKQNKPNDPANGKPKGYELIDTIISEAQK